MIITIATVMLLRISPIRDPDSRLTPRKRQNSFAKVGTWCRTTMNIKNLSSYNLVSKYHNSPLVFLLHTYWRRRHTLKLVIFSTFGLLWPWPLIGSYTHHHVALTDLHLNTKFRLNRKKLFAERRTDITAMSALVRHTYDISVTSSCLPRCSCKDFYGQRAMLWTWRMTKVAQWTMNEFIFRLEKKIRTFLIHIS